MFLALVVILAAFPLVAEFPIPMIVLVLGLRSTATIVLLQSLVLRRAGAAPTLSLAVDVGAMKTAAITAYGGPQSSPSRMLRPVRPSSRCRAPATTPSGGR